MAGNSATKNFPGGVAPPAPLDTAIQNASKKFDVPPDLLVGIWRVESGSKYPNPYANGLGYGGEFGTKITQPFGSASDVRQVPEPPVQQQADLSAYILSQLLQKNGGDVSKALLSYSGGGYSSVPGQVTTNYKSKGPFQSWTPGQPLPSGSILGQAASLPGSIIKGAENTVGSAATSVGMEILYGMAFIGSVLIILTGFVLIGADLGIAILGRTRAAKAGTIVVENVIPRGRQRKRDEEAYRNRKYRTSREGISKKDSVRVVKPQTDVSRPLKKQKQADDIPF